MAPALSLIVLLACQVALAQAPAAPTAKAPAAAGPTNVVVAFPQTIDRASIARTLQSLPTKRSANADIAHAEGLANTEAYLVEQLGAMDLTPTLEPVRWAPPIRPTDENKRPEPREWHNIIVEFPGTAIVADTSVGLDGMTHGTPTHATIVVGAHFDAVPLAPGADDNGSGVAALLELARAYKALHDAGWTHGSTIRLIFFNLEEVGLVGSARHLEQWKIKSLGLDRKPDAAEGAPGPGPVAPKASPVRERISLMLSLECLGFFSDKPNSQNSPFKAIPGVFEPPTVADNLVLVTIAKHQGMCKDLEAAMLKAAPALKIFRADFSPLPLPDLMRSDHAPFLLAGVPAFMITDTANFRNPNYHKPTDTVDTLDLPRLTLVTQAVAGAVWELAQPTAPQHEPRP